MKKEILIVAALVLAATGILLALNLTSEKPNKHKNGFVRKVVNNAIEEVSRINVPDGITKITNINNDTLYLQTNDPETIYYTSDFKHIKKLELPFYKTNKFKSLFTSYVRFPNAYILSGNERQAVIINVETKEINTTHLLIPGAFSNSIYLNDSQWIVRYIDSTSYNSLFAKINIKNGNFDTEQSISPKLNDAGFTNDGILVYEHNSLYLSFVQFYNNQITLFDTSFNINGKFHTIDTSFTSGIKLRIDSNGVTTSAPPKIINGASSVANNILYIHSYLTADNELNDSGLDILDRYDQQTGKYINSFYLPKTSGKRLLGICISDQNLYALYNRMLIKTRIEN